MSADWVSAAIEAWLRNLVGQSLPTALQAAGLLVFQTPAFDGIPEIRSIWQVARGAADALYGVALLAGGVLVMASGTFDSRYTVKLLLPRVVLAAVASNLSLSLCGLAISLENALVVALLGPDPAGGTWAQLTARIQAPDLPSLALFSLIALAVAVLTLGLVIAYIARDLVLLLATVLAPLAVAAYAIPQTEEVARLWMRVYGAGLGVQVVHALLVKVGVELIGHGAWLGTPGSALVDALVLLSLLCLMVKLPLAGYRWAFRHSAGSLRIGQAVTAAAASLHRATG